jgi:hypothetical protein
MNLTDELCACGHTHMAHDYSVRECNLCDCKRFRWIEYTTTTLPPHFLHEDVYYDGNRYIDFKNIVSYWHEQTINGMAVIDISLANGYKFRATSYGGDSYLYDALLEWHKRMGNLLDRRMRERS